MQGFALRFGAGAFSLILLFELVRGAHIEQRIFAATVLVPAAELATWLNPENPAAVSSRRLISLGATLNVTRGCEGMETLSLFVAAVLAFPGTWRRRVIALGVGVPLIYILSVVRLGALFWVLDKHHGLFDAIHGVVAPLAPLVVVSSSALRL